MASRKLLVVALFLGLSAFAQAQTNAAGDANAELQHLKHGKHKVVHDPEYYEKDGYKSDPEYVLVYKPKSKPTRPPSPYAAEDDLYDTYKDDSDYYKPHAPKPPSPKPPSPKPKPSPSPAPPKDDYQEYKPTPPPPSPPTDEYYEEYKPSPPPPSPPTDEYEYYDRPPSPSPKPADDYYKPRHKPRPPPPGPPKGYRPSPPPPSPPKGGYRHRTPTPPPRDDYYPSEDDNYPPNTPPQSPPEEPEEYPEEKPYPRKKIAPKDVKFTLAERSPTRIPTSAAAEAEVRETVVRTAMLMGNLMGNKVEAGSITWTGVVTSTVPAAPPATTKTAESIHYLISVEITQKEWEGTITAAGVGKSMYSTHYSCFPIIGGSGLYEAATGTLCFYPIGELYDFEISLWPHKRRSPRITYSKAELLNGAPVGLPSAQ